MKNNFFKYIFTVLFFIAIFFGFSIEKTEASLATLGFTIYDNLDHNSVEFSVNMSSNGGESILWRGFCYNTSYTYLEYPEADGSTCVHHSSDDNNTPGV